MIIRILGEGQWRVADDELDGLNQLDDQLSAAVASGDESGVHRALEQIQQRVRAGEPVPDDELAGSGLIIPSPGASLAEVRALLDENSSGEGLIPG